MAGVRLVSRVPTASRRTRRGLDTSLTPRPISPPCGECLCVALRETSKPKTETGATEVTVDADLGSPFRFRCVSWNGRLLLSDLLPSLSVHPSHQVNTVAFLHIVCCQGACHFGGRTFRCAEICEYCKCTVRGGANFIAFLPRGSLDLKEFPYASLRRSLDVHAFRDGPLRNR